MNFKTVSQTTCFLAPTSCLANTGSETLVIPKNVKENVKITRNVTYLCYMNEEDGKVAGSKQR